jgi:hypothetical protein
MTITQRYIAIAIVSAVILIGFVAAAYLEFMA